MEASIPLMQVAWRKQYKEGYDARVAGDERRTHHARRRGLWFQGWDEADKDLGNANESEI